MNKVFQIKHLCFDFDDFKVTSNGVDMSIDHTAVEVFKLMVENSGQTVSNITFMETVWANKPSAPEVIPAAIARLRKLFKQTGISDDLIVTVHKVGYRFEPLTKENIPVKSQTIDKPAPTLTVKIFLILLSMGLLVSIYYNYKYSSLKPELSYQAVSQPPKHRHP